MPPRVTALTTKACALFGQATESNAQRRRLNRGARLLRRAAAKVKKAGDGGRIPLACSTALANDLTDARTRAQHLAGMR